MADTLANIEADAQHYANDSQLNAVSGQGLRVSNRLYNGMTTPGYRAGFAGTLVTIGRRWPELLKSDTGLTTTSGTAKYALPSSRSGSTTVDDTSSGSTLPVAATTSFRAGDRIRINSGGGREEVNIVDSVSSGVSLAMVFALTNVHTLAQADAVVIENLVFHMEELTVVYVDASSNSYEYVIGKSPSEREWADHFSSNNAIPLVWKQYYDGSNNVIEFRPAPDTTSDTIKLWGYVQATPFATSASTTEFIHKNSDYALALLIAADWLAKRDKTSRSRQLISEAVALLPSEDSGSRIRGSGMLTPWGHDAPHGSRGRYAGF